MPKVAPAVFWVCGASGAGKSVAAWALFKALAADGVRVGYVDIDQLGMLYPATDDDPERHLLKEAALVALMPGYVWAGAQVLVVSGVLNSAVGPAAVMAADVDLTLCLLSPEPDALRKRISARGGDEQEAEDAVAENVALQAAWFVDTTIDTAGLSVAMTAMRLKGLVRLRAGSTQAVPPSVVRSPAEVGVVVLTGPRGVGTSTVGFALARNRWSADQRTGFVDVQQLAFLAGPGSAGRAVPSLAITQLAAMHNFVASRGAGLLVVAGHLSAADRDALRDALPAAAVTVVRLRADVTTFEGHIRDRVLGSGPRLAGDDLPGASRDYQEALIAAAIAEQKHFDTGANDDAVLDVTDRTPADVVAELERLIAAQKA